MIRRVYLAGDGIVENSAHAFRRSGWCGFAFLRTPALAARCLRGGNRAGRGCLAGPVVAAAVVFPSRIELDGVTDSKALSDAQRRKLLPLIRQRATAIGVGIRSARRIDQTDILVQTKQAMLAAIADLQLAVDVLLIDGNQKIPTDIEQHPSPILFEQEG